jgi:hypothetical protein
MVHTVQNLEKIWIWIHILKFNNTYGLLNTWLT